MKSKSAFLPVPRVIIVTPAVLPSKKQCRSSCKPETQEQIYKVKVKMSQEVLGRKISSLTRTFGTMWVID